MLSLRGSAALSPFRLDKILAALKTAVPRVTHLYAEFWHFAWAEGALTAAQQVTLQKILTYGPKMAEETPSGDLFLVISVKPDSIYERKGDDLNVDIDVDLVKAMLGGEVPVCDRRAA